MKRCSKCKETKDDSLFYGRSDEKGSGFWSHCKECVKARRRLYVLGNREKIKSLELKRSFGIDLTQYNQMFAAQSGCCAICGKHSTEFKQMLAVDHDHATGQVRELLCHHCNHGIGKFRESEDLLQKAIQYLRNHGSESAESNSDVAGRDAS